MATSIVASLRGTGFSKATEPVKKRLLVNIEGEEKSGKTNLALTAPGPICILNIDRGLEGVIQKFQSGKEIFVASYKTKLDISQLRELDQKAIDKVADEAHAIWSSLMKDYRAALASGAKTIIGDTGSDLWELLRLARFGKLMQVKSHHYGPVNAEFRRFIHMAEESDVNLILLHRLKEEYKGDKPTGKLVMAGFNEISYMMHTNVRCWRDFTASFPDFFRATVIDCRQNPEAHGFEFAGTDVNFQNLGMTVFPDTSEDDWR